MVILYYQEKKNKTKRKKQPFLAAFPKTQKFRVQGQTTKIWYKKGGYPP